MIARVHNAVVCVYKLFITKGGIQRKTENEEMIKWNLLLKKERVEREEGTCGSTIGG
jgi:hypothetical protein